MSAPPPATRAGHSSLSARQYLGVLAVAALAALVVSVLFYAVAPPRILYVPVTDTASAPVASPDTPLPITEVAPTPEARFSSAIGMGGYSLVTLEQVGDLPPNTRVRISHSIVGDDGQWRYVIVAEDEQRSAEASEDQIDYIPGVLPGAPTPTAAFGSLVGLGVRWAMLTEPVGDLGAEMAVRVAGARLGSTGWVYTVTVDEQTFVEVHERQLAYLPNVTPGAPTPTFTP